jgi:hypothetical protein
VSRLVVHRARELRRGDRILKLGAVDYNPPREVLAPLAPIAGQVVGVRTSNPCPGSPVEYVLYPSQIDGTPMLVDRHADDGPRPAWDRVGLVDADTDNLVR